MNELEITLDHAWTKMRRQFLEEISGEPQRIECVILRGENNSSKTASQQPCAILVRVKTRDEPQQHVMSIMLERGKDQSALMLERFTWRSSEDLVGIDIVERPADKSPYDKTGELRKMHWRVHREAQGPSPAIEPPQVVEGIKLDDKNLTVACHTVCPMCGEMKIMCSCGK